MKHIKVEAIQGLIESKMKLPKNNIWILVGHK